MKQLSISKNCRTAEAANQLILDEASERINEFKNLGGLEELVNKS